MSLNPFSTGTTFYYELLLLFFKFRYKPLDIDDPQTHPYILEYVILAFKTRLRTGEPPL